MPIDINKALNTLQQSSKLSTMYKIDKQLIRIFHQCCLKIELLVILVTMVQIFVNVCLTD